MGLSVCDGVMVIVASVAVNTEGAGNGVFAPMRVRVRLGSGVSGTLRRIGVRAVRCEAEAAQRGAFVERCRVERQSALFCVGRRNA